MNTYQLYKNRRNPYRGPFVPAVATLKTNPDG
jgi:hypothetical protein